MLGALSRALDRFRGSGDASATVPPLDGAFRPNERLESATVVFSVEAPDNLTSDKRRILFSSGATLFELILNEGSANAEIMTHFDSSITCLDLNADGSIAVGLAGGFIFLRNGAYDGRKIAAMDGRPAACPTAVRFIDADTMIVCLGSRENDPTEWKRDLLNGNASGSVWRVDLRDGRSACLADQLAWPNGIVATGQERVVVAESWRHRLLDLSGGRCFPLLAELPGYPARIVDAANEGFWLAISAPRSQLMEFVLRERRFRERMMREIDQEFWVAPSLHQMSDYREPLQSGAIKQLGELKPWAPSRSYGLVVRLDADFNPIESMHSRANGKRHGITSCLQINGSLLATSKGSGAILNVDLATPTEPVA
jgi:hypothetical protein